MTAYIALLRGINVGGNKKIAMADLRALLSKLGHTDVRTLLNSGNAVFTNAQRDPAAIAATIEAAIRDELGMSVRVLVRTAAELRATVEGNPLGEVHDGSRFVVVFLSTAPDAEHLAQFAPDQFAPERFATGARELYLSCPNGQRDSVMVKVLAEKRKDVVATARNWNTVTKLLAMAEEA